MFAMHFHLTRVEGSVRVVQPTQHGVDRSVGEVLWVATGWLTPQGDSGEVREFTDIKRFDK